MIERHILGMISHPFVVKLHYSFQTKDKLYFALDYVPGGELFSTISKEGIFVEEEAAFYAAEVALALHYLHGVGVIYRCSAFKFRDLKPENILLDRTGHIKLTDFGLCFRSFEETHRASTQCGTVEYMAPEVFSKKPYDCNVDWWSLGVLVYDMMAGSPPFKGKTAPKIIESIKMAKVAFPKHISPDGKDLILKAFAF
jgi:serine/threonine protein kinase